MSEQPEVSVVIPTRDRVHFLRGAVQSALSQGDVDLEVVVVDDGSRDETPMWLASQSDPRVRVRRLERAQGVAKARNHGIEMATGTWLAFLDDDDLWAPLKLRKQLDAAGPETVLVYAATVELDDDGVARKAVPGPDPTRLRRELIVRNSIPAGSSNVLARREVVRQLDGFDDRLSQLADWALWIRLSGAGAAAACEETLVAYRYHAGNMLLTRGEDVMHEFACLLKKHQRTASELGAAFDRTAFTYWAAGGLRRAGRRREAAKLYLRSALARRSAADFARALGTLAGESAMRTARRIASPPPDYP